MKILFKKLLQRLSLTFAFGLLTHCGAPDSYQGDGMWLKADGTSYRGPAPMTVSNVQVLGSPYIRERIRETEEKSTNSQGQIVIRQKEITTIQMNFQLLVTLENGEQHQMSFSISGNHNDSQYTSSLFTGSNGYSYRASGQVQLSQFNPTYQMTISSKGAANWQGTIPLR